jgi:surface carbohydrate biosynthesis protein
VTCYLVPHNLRHSEIWTLAPDFVLLNFLRKINEGFARQLAEAGIQFGVLDTEGGVLVSLDSYGQVLAQDEQVRAQAACHCSWGQRLAEHAVRSGWFAREQVAVTGSPRFDFYTMPWRQAALQTSAHAAPYERNLVLVNGNFSIANPRFQSPEAEFKMLVDRFDYDPDVVLGWQRTQHRTMHELVALTSRLACRFPQATFVYRPHPFERLETYEGLLEKRGNLHLIKAGTVDGWILRARAVIQRSCSTAIEAGLASVPALSPAWIPTAFEMPVAEEVSVRCETEDELSQALQSILSDDFECPAYIQHRLEEVIDEWFYRVDGQAHRRVADAILCALNGPGPCLSINECRDMAYGLGRSGTSLRRRVGVTLGKTLGLSVHWSFRRWGPVLTDLSWWDTSEKYFDADQVRALVDAIQACAQDASKEPLRKVGVALAQERGDYHFGYLQGRSVTVFLE